ncbi:hypothetical protein LRM64_19355, partial [Prescottella equi]
RAGVISVDRDQFTAMQAELAANREFRTRHETAEVTSYLNQAMATGKFPPSKLSHYETLMAEAPKATRALIDELPANAFPVSEVGHDGDAVNQDDHSVALSAVADRVGFGRADHF